jgi:ATP-dependent DNA helicase RecG
MDGKVQVLVATVVVEVGVDVPEATVMLIEGADRFGLAQLHQLRGRVGRSGRASHCFLIAGNGDGTPGEAAVQRLGALERTSDGFEIAEADLVYRGPGELVGSKQAGQLPAFALTDLRLEEDRAILEEAREAAERVMAENPSALPEHLAAALAIYPPLPRLDVLPGSLAPSARETG